MRAVTVHDAKMPLVEYQGQPVVTFAMIDEAHQRPKDTAKKAFQRNRRHFIEGKDYFVVSAASVDGLARGIKRPGKKITSPIRGNVTVFTEFGYLLLTKPFTDDLAWQVQRQLVNGYFRPSPDFSDIRPVPIPSLAELEAMPLQQAQNILAAADHKSHWRHGKHGSAEMTQRKRELKLLRPAIARITALIQITIPGLEVAK